MEYRKLRTAFFLSIFYLCSCQGGSGVDTTSKIPPPGQVRVPHWMIVSEKQNLWSLTDLEILKDALKVRLDVSTTVHDIVERSPELAFFIGASHDKLAVDLFKGINTKTKVFIFTAQTVKPWIHPQVQWLHFDLSFLKRLELKLGADFKLVEVGLEWEPFLRALSQGGQFGESIGFRSGYFRISDKSKKLQDKIREFSLSELAPRH